MSTRRSNSADQAGAIKRFACILAMTIAAISLQLAGCSEELTRPAGESGSSLEKCFQLPTVDGVVAAIDIDRNGSLGTESLAEPPRIIVDPEMLQIPEPDVVTSATTTIIDFETPSLGSALSLVIDPYIDATSGVMFASAGGTLGLVKNLLTSACVDPPSSDQKLASGMGRTIGFSGRPIQAVFPTELPAGSTISVEIQALAGTIGRVTLFDGDFSPVGETEAVLEPPNGTCGYPGSPRARTVVSVTATGPVKHVRIDVPYLNAVMVIDDFSFSAPANYSLDIRPGSCPNPLNRISRGVLPVALLTTAEFDALQVDLASIVFGDPVLLDDGAIGVGPNPREPRFHRRRSRPPSIPHRARGRPDPLSAPRM